VEDHESRQLPGEGADDLGVAVPEALGDEASDQTRTKGAISATRFGLKASWAMRLVRV
jgi:hypothetical protein